jgi:hypothetical protein
MLIVGYKVMLLIRASDCVGSGFVFPILIGVREHVDVINYINVGAIEYNITYRLVIGV